MATAAFKCALVGDAGIGKTSLLYKHVLGSVPEVQCCLVSCDSHVTMSHVDGEKVQLCLWDTEGSKDYNSLRPFSYPNTNVFLLCFSVDEPKSFKSVKDRWYPELHHHCPGVPILLVGTKEDLRDNGDSEAAKAHVTTEEGLKMVREIGGGGYAECSASSGVGVTEVFIQAAKLARAPPTIITTSSRQGRRWKCIIS